MAGSNIKAWQVDRGTGVDQFVIVEDVGGTPGLPSLDASQILNLDTSQVTSGTFDDARISETSVSQHQNALTISSSQVTEISNLTADEGAQLENIDSNTISNTQWGYVGNLDQAVDTTSSVQFQNVQTPSLNGGPLAGLRNKLINGNFSINQRAYPTGSTITLSENQYFFDRWRGGIAATEVQVSTTGVVTMVNIGAIEQVIEGDVSTPKQGETVTISMENPSNDFNITLLNSLESDTSTGTITAGSGRQSVTLTVPSLSVGDNIIVQIANTVSNATFEQVQLEFGTIATEFEHRLPILELTFCHWYFERITVRDGVAVASLNASSTSVASGVLTYNPKGGTSPLITESNNGFWTLLGAGGAETLSSFSFAGERSTALIEWNDGGTPFTVGNGFTLIASGGDEYIDIDEEL